VSIPRPLRAMRRSSQRLSRYAQITGIAVKHGFGPALGLARPQREPAATASSQLLGPEGPGLQLTPRRWLRGGCPRLAG
jgi:hypothetical protein